MDGPLRRWSPGTLEEYSCAGLERESKVREKMLGLVAAAAGIVLLLAALRPPPEEEEGTGQPLDPPPPPQETIRVEVLNGCGVPQVAARLTRRVRSLGLDVIHEGNAESFGFLPTIVIDRRGDLAKARHVAAVLGVPHCIQQIAEDAFRLADVTVVIGSDFKRMGLLDSDE